jgi:hypothetical protein
MVASLLDSQSNALTRPEQLMFSQFLLGFGSAFFLAPAMLAGIGGVLPTRATWSASRCCSA